MANIDKDKGFSPISRKPMKESEMSPERRHHRESVRKADSRSKAIEKAKGGKKMVRVSVGKKPEEIGHTIEDHKGRVLKKYEPAKKDSATRRYEGGGTFYGR